jgi:hypothetical protein
MRREKDWGQNYRSKNRFYEKAHLKTQNHCKQNVTIQKEPPSKRAAVLFSFSEG